MNSNSSPFKWRHYAPGVILLCVRCYCRFQLLYRDIEEMMRERGLEIDHTTVFRRAPRYAPEINKRIRQHLKMSGTFIKKKVRASQCYKSFHTAERTLEGIEAVNMLRKGQAKRLSGNDVRGQAKFVINLFQDAA